MPGLIPLMLNPVAAGNRSSVIFSPSQSTKRYSRGQSINLLPLPINSPQSPSFPQSVSPRTPQRTSLPLPPKAKPAKRPSLASPSVLPVLPYSPEDWRRSIAEVKRQHANRRYRACFTRCNEILDTIKYTPDIEPVYLISLHFYAATSLEMCARPLSASAYRAELLQKAQAHYGRAAVLIQEAEESAHFKQHASLSLLPLSSPQSPSESVSSRAWTLDTGLSSPTPSVCSSEDLNARLYQHSPSLPNLLSFPKSACKKVSFELPKEDPPRFEPYIRPDSPTLGFDDEYFVTGLSRQELPEIPCRQKPPVSGPSAYRAEDNDATPRVSRAFYALGQSELGTHADSTPSSRQVNSSANRYCAHLSDLKSRVAQHRTNLADVLHKPAEGGSELSDRSPAPVHDESHALERKARIERLRKNGWQRKRFDPSRYEALRTAALAELE